MPIPAPTPPPRSHRLIDFTASRSRDNNFNLLRFIAAFAVLVSHSYPIAGDPAEPLHRTLGFSLGGLAVDIFFVTSGFLLTQSLLVSRTLIAFTTARILRIFPALIASLLFAAFVIGPALTSLSPAAYFSDHAPYVFVFWNSLLIVKPLVAQLPGLFATNPLPGLVNGSLWTLPIEFQLYLSLIATGALALLLKPAARTRFITLAVLALGAAIIAIFLVRGIATNTFPIRRAHLAAMFFSGAILFLAARHIRLDWRIAIALLAALALCVPWQPLFFPLYTLGLGYLVLWLGYAPAGPLRLFNRVGDYSYGIYVYAFPVQQAIVHLSLRDTSAAAHPLHPVSLMLLSGLITLALAVLSWHCVEKPAMNKRLSWSSALESLLSFKRLPLSPQN